MISIAEPNNLGGIIAFTVSIVILFILYKSNFKVYISITSNWVISAG
jgi:hypothetical protein